MITTTTTFVRLLHCHLRRLQRLNEWGFFLALKDEMWSYLLLPKKRLLELSAFAIKQTFNFYKLPVFV